MTLPKKSTTKGNIKKLTTAAATKKAKPVLSERIEQGVSQVYEWFKEAPSSWDRLERSVSLLDTLTSRSESDFVEALLGAYEADNHHHKLSDELQRLAQITKQPIFNQIADQLAKL